jgi:DNA-binding NarL/FixJ family response regulator
MKIVINHDKLSTSKIAPREYEIIECIISGITNSKDIALELSISTKTVKNYFSKLFDRFKARSRLGLLVRFIELQIVLVVPDTWTPPGAIQAQNAVRPTQLSLFSI